MSKKIGVLLVGMNGSVGNTLIAGCLAARMKELPVYGMITEMEAFSHIAFPDWRDFEFSGWDIDQRSALEVAYANEIVPRSFVADLEKELSVLHPLSGVLTQSDYYFQEKQSRSTKQFSLLELLECLEHDIADIKKDRSLDTCYVVNVSSPSKAEIRDPAAIDRVELERMIDSNNPAIDSSVLYALAALRNGCGFVDFTSSQTLELKGLQQISQYNNLPIAGRDGATGETSLKAMLSEFLLKRNLRVTGWFSTNILGNNDGKVLSTQGHGSTKVTDKKSVAPDILGYSDFDNLVNIEYYSPRGDNKEAWNVIDFKGWLGLDMSMRIDWQGRDSILAAPMILDLVRHLSYSHDRGEKGLIHHLGIYFKHPIGSRIRGFSEAYRSLIDHYV